MRDRWLLWLGAGLLAAGVGLAVTPAAGVAAADNGTTSTSAESGTDSKPADTKSEKPTAKAKKDQKAEKKDKKAGKGEAEKGDKGEKADKKKASKDNSEKKAESKDADPKPTATEPGATKPTTVDPDTTVSTEPKPRKAKASTAEKPKKTEAQQLSEVTKKTTAEPAAAVTESVTKPTPPNPVRDVVLTVLSVVGWSPSREMADAFPEKPDPFAVLDWARVAHPWHNVAPTATVTQGRLVGADREGDALSYRVVRAPQSGTVSVDPKTGEFAYTPDTAGTADWFTVAVDDGHRAGITVVAVGVEPDGLTRDVDVTVGHSTLDLPCGRGCTVPADWYVPNNPVEPSGVIWLQHGFFAQGPWYDKLAMSLAEETNSIVVTPSLSSDFLTCQNCWINGESVQRAAAQVLSDRTALIASAKAAGFEGTLPDDVVLAGHSAGGGFATTVASYLTPEAQQHLKGVVMFDGVSLSDKMRQALATLPADIPVLQLAAPSYVWNSFGSGTADLLAARPGQFVGVQLVGGSHVDSMQGSNLLISLAGQLVAGFSQPQNVQAVRTISTSWINDLWDGIPPGEVEVADATAIPLPTPPTASTPIENLLRELTVAAERLFFTTSPASPIDVVGGAVFHIFTAAITAFTGPPMVPPGSPVTVHQAPLQIGEITVPADWYFPNQAEPPTGIIYLQHGSQAVPAMYSYTAAELAQKTNSIVVAPSVPSYSFGTEGNWLGGAKLQEAAADLFAGGRAALVASAKAAGYDGPLPASFVLTGHSLGGGFVAGMASHAGTNENFAGVVLLDPYAYGDGIARAMRTVPDDVPVYMVGAPANYWNQLGAAARELSAARPGQFVGVVLEGGSHVDAMSGANAVVQIAEQLVVGGTQPRNAEAARALAAEWINAMLAGTPVDGPIAGERVTIPTAAGPATAIGVPDPDSQVSPIDVLLVTFTNLLNGLALGDEITAANQQELAMLIRV